MWARVDYPLGVGCVICVYALSPGIFLKISGSVYKCYTSVIHVGLISIHFDYNYYSKNIDIAVPRAYQAAEAAGA